MTTPIGKRKRRKEEWAFRKMKRVWIKTLFSDKSRGQAGASVRQCKTKNWVRTNAPPEVRLYFLFLKVTQPAPRLSIKHVINSSGPVHSVSFTTLHYMVCGRPAEVEKIGSEIQQHMLRTWPQSFLQFIPWPHPTPLRFVQPPSFHPPWSFSGKHFSP